MWKTIESNTEKKTETLLECILNVNGYRLHNQLQIKTGRKQKDLFSPKNQKKLRKKKKKLSAETKNAYFIWTLIRIVTQWGKLNNPHLWCFRTTKYSPPYQETFPKVSQQFPAVTIPSV